MTKDTWEERFEEKTNLSRIITRELIDESLYYDTGENLELDDEKVKQFISEEISKAVAIAKEEGIKEGRLEGIKELAKWQGASKNPYDKL